MDDVIIFDWLSFTSKSHGVGSIVDMLGLVDVPFNRVKGARGYVHREYYDGISIHHGGRDEIWVEMSGQGCRCFETLSSLGWFSLFQIFISDRADYHVTRLDAAYDDRSGMLDLDVMSRDMYSGNFVSTFDFWDLHLSSVGVSLYHGSPKSDIRIRIYDKARERKREDEGHWVRCEIQMRDERAEQFIRLVVADGRAGDVFSGVLRNYLRYVNPATASGRQRTDLKRRWPEAEYWSEFVGAVERIKLFAAPGVDYNIMKLEDFAVNQAGSAAAAYMQIVGADEYISQVMQRYEKVRNPKHVDLVQKMVYDKINNS